MYNEWASTASRKGDAYVRKLGFRLCFRPRGDPPELPVRKMRRLSFSSADSLPNAIPSAISVEEQAWKIMQEPLRCIGFYGGDFLFQ